MIQALLARKLGMTQLFTDEGEAVGVTAVEAGPCVVTQVKTQARDGYDAVQLGFGQARRLNKPLQGHLRQTAPFRYLREVPVQGLGDIQVGQRVDASLFQAGDHVDIIGVSKGRGFAGVVKRHHFAGGPKTRGQSDRHRGPGAIGAGSTPGRVLKGRRMAGHMGHERVTVQNVVVVRADAERNLLLLKGSVPGPRDTLVIIRHRKGKG